MKRRLSEAAVSQIMSHLLERFGEPIGDAQGDGQGVPSGHKKKDMGNRGFGARFHECGGMMGIEGESCTKCGEMSPHIEPDGSLDMGHHEEHEEHEEHPHVEPDGSIDMGHGHAEPDGDEEVIVVVGGHKSLRGAVPGGKSGRFAAGVHPPKDMDVPPEALPKKGKPSAPSAPPSRVREGRYSLSPQEVLTTWEDLYVDSLRSRRKGDVGAGPAGVVSLESLASWLGVPPEAVKSVMPKVGLLLDKDGNVVSRGHTPAPMAAVKA